MQIPAYPGLPAWVWPRHSAGGVILCIGNSGNFQNLQFFKIKWISNNYQIHLKLPDRPTLLYRYVLFIFRYVDIIFLDIKISELLLTAGSRTNSILCKACLSESQKAERLISSKHHLAQSEGREYARAGRWRWRWVMLTASILRTYSRFRRPRSSAPVTLRLRRLPSTARSRRTRSLLTMPQLIALFALLSAS